MRWKMNGPVNIERPNTKWTFVKFSKIQVQVVLDSRAGNAWNRPVATETACATVVTAVKWWRWTLLMTTCSYDAVLPCIRGASRSLLKGKRFQRGLGSKSMSLSAKKTVKTVWHLRKNPSDQLQNIITIGFQTFVKRLLITGKREKTASLQQKRVRARWEKPDTARSRNGSATTKKPTTPCQAKKWGPTRSQFCMILNHGLIRNSGKLHKLASLPSYVFSESHRFLQCMVLQTLLLTFFGLPLWCSTACPCPFWRSPLCGGTRGHRWTPCCLCTRCALRRQVSGCGSFHTGAGCC